MKFLIFALLINFILEDHGVRIVHAPTASSALHVLIKYVSLSDIRGSTIGEQIGK